MATIVKKGNKYKPWTVRYVDNGRQHERSFRTRREADDFKAKFEHDSRERVFVDPRVANEKFRNAAQSWLDRHTGKPRTKQIYADTLRLHILPAIGEKRLSDVASDREGLQTFLLVTLPAQEQGVSQVRKCYMIINAVVNDAIKTGKLSKSRIRGLPLPASPRTKASDFVFPGRGQIEALAAKLGDHGLAVYLMRGCGLRVNEALGVRWGDFRDGGKVLRLARQREESGLADRPLKARAEGDHRDVPVPAYVWDRVRAARPAESLEDGPVFPYGYATGSRRGFGEHFTAARAAAGIPATFTSHSLRHVFASVALSQGVPITDVSHWLGHRNIQTTYGIYGHLVPSSWDRARDALDREWAA